MSGRVSKFGIVQNISVDLIDDSPFQIRMEYENIPDLAENISKQGLLVPLLVRPKAERYELVHGHRRLRAVKSLTQKFVFTVIRELTDKEALLIHGSENIYRREYSPIEEARYYKQCLENGLTIDEIRTRAKKGRRGETHIKNYVAFLDLPNDIQLKIHRKKLSIAKAVEVTKLTRKPPTNALVGANGRFIAAPKTEEYVEEIRVLVDSNLRDSKAVSVAVDEIRKGTDLEEAIKEGEKDYRKRKSKERASKPSPSPEQLAEQLIANLPNPSSLDDKIKAQYPKLVRQLLDSNLLVCPDCGLSHLVWKCSGREINGD